MRSLILLISLMASLWAIDTGSLSFYLMKDGKPMGKHQVVIFKKTESAMFNMPAQFDKHAEFMTDEDGYLGTVLPVGGYQIQLVAVENNLPQAYVKKPFAIEKNKESQIIVSLEEDNTVAFEDSESPVAQVAAADTNGTVKENGDVLINLVSAEDNEVIADARIFVQGQSVNLTTDKNGNASLKLPEGEHTVSIIHSNFSAQTLKITVVANEVVNKSYEMTPASMELSEFVVLAPHVEGSVASSINEVRNSSAVEDVMGSEQFSKAGDSDAAGALKRASGLTLVGGKYVYIRGLGDRYSSSLLNGLELPSPEPTKRVVPLDLFPTSVIKSIAIQKSYSANLPANFGGGNIDIRTVDTPDEFFAKASVEGKYNSEFTGDDKLMSKGATSDNTGYDQFRGLSNSTLRKADDLNYFVDDRDTDVKADLVKNAAGFKKQEIKPGYKLAASFGDSFEVSDESRLGYVFSYSYDNDWESFDQKRGTLSSSAAGFSAPTNYDGKDVVSNEIKHGGIFAFTYDINQDHKIKQTNLYINHSSDVSSITDESNEDGNDVNKYFLSWVERSLFLSQLEGSHEFDFLGDLRLNWAGEYGHSERFEPLTKDYTYLDQDGSLQLTRKDSMNFVSSELEDDLFNLNGNAVFPFHLTDDKSIESNIEVGGYMMRKERESETRRFSLGIIDNAAIDATGADRTGDVDGVFNTNNLDLLELRTNFKAADFYEGTHDIDAAYIRANIKPIDELEVVLGIRREESTQIVDTYDVSQNPVSYEIVTEDDLPEAIGTYHITDDMQIRASYAETVTRPDFREFAPTRYQDPITGDIIFGNEDLQPTDIEHYDTRFEWYFSPKEMVSIGAFYKDFTNPIETIQTKDDTPTYTYINADEAELYGIEVAFRKDLSFIDSIMENIYVGGNVALIDSEITLSDETINTSLVTSSEREMQGQSPFVVNLQVGYENEGRIITLLYNTIGERIVSLGVEGDPDTYEEPFHQLDLVYSETISDSLVLQFKLKNIINDDVEWTQEDYVVRSHKKGTDFTAKMEYKF